MRASTAAKRGLSRFYYGWVMVGTGSAVNAMAAVNGAASTVFFLPITRDLGISRAALALALSLARLESGFVGPVAGWLLDKKGPRLTITLGATLGGIGLILLPHVNSLLTFMLVYMGVTSIGFNLGFILSTHQIANLWFARYRTRVLSVFSAFLRLGTALFTPLLAYLVLRYGWRTTAVVAGLAVLCVVLPLTLLVKRSPEAIGQVPDGAAGAIDGATKDTHGGHTGTSAGVDLTFKQALKTAPYWIIVFSTIARLSLTGAVRGQIVPILVTKGMSEQTGAWVAGFSALAAIPMVLLLGYIGDKTSKKAVLIAGQASMTLAMVVLVIANASILLLGVFVFLVAFADSVAPINYSIVGDFFGRKAFGRLVGTFSTFGTVGIVAPPFLGWTYDHYHNYTLGLLSFSVVAGMALLFLLFLRRPRAPETELADASAASAGSRDGNGA